MNVNSSFNDTKSSLYPGEAMRILQMIITVLIFVVGVLLNGLVVWALGLRARIRRGTGETQGASSFRTYVVNLAVADLVLLLRTPLMLTYLAHNFNWTLGEPVCKLIIYLRCLGLYASAFLLCAVAVERCLCLLRPVWARLRRPRWVVPLACAVIWLLAAALASPYIQAAKLVVVQNHTNCIESNEDFGQALIVLETMAGFFLPLVIFLSCNIAVLFSAKRAESAAPTSPVSSPMSSSGPTYTSQRLTRLYRVLFLTMILFLTCWVPYFTCRFLIAISQDKSKLRTGAIGAAYVALFLVYIKSALNPILYVFAARGLGRTVRASLLSTFERVFNDEFSDSIRRKSSQRKDSQF